jgi:arylsulfatase A-like enzyme
MPGPTNVLLIAIDSLRASHMSLYGFDRLTTPHIDRWARGGVVYDNHITASVPTTPAFGAMLTGMDVFTSGLVGLENSDKANDSVVTLPELLRKAGYESTCIGFGDKPPEKIGDLFGSVRGFDNYLSYKSKGPWEDGPIPKADNLNDVAIPELKRLAGSGRPFMMMTRHLDPHSPYLPPAPFDRLFYGGDEYDPSNHSLDAVREFKPFSDYFAPWFPPGCTDKDYIIAQYHGAVAYMDACIAKLLRALADLGLEDDTLVVLLSDHGETLDDHDMWFDHHGLYEVTLRVPLVFRLPGRLPEGRRIDTTSVMANITPTILDLIGVDAGSDFDGTSLAGEMRGETRTPDDGVYLAECHWMRKHGWRTPEWKYIHALEPDFHGKAEIELYDLAADPDELTNLAEQRPDICEQLERRMQEHIALREKQTGRTNPLAMGTRWVGGEDIPRPFASSREAYEALHIGDHEAGARARAVHEKAVSLKRSSRTS